VAIPERYTLNDVFKRTRAKTANITATAIPAPARLLVTLTWYDAVEVVTTLSSFRSPELSQLI